MKQLGTLYQYEIRKILRKKMTWIAFGGVVLVMLFLCFGVLLDTYSLSNAQTGESISYSQYDAYKEKEKAAEDLNGRLIDDVLLQEMQAAYAGVQTQEQTLPQEGDLAGGIVSVETVVSQVPDDQEEAERQTEQRRGYRGIYDYVREVVGNEEVNIINAAGLYGGIRQMRTDYEQILYLSEEESEYWQQQGPEEPYRYYWNIMGPERLLASYKTVFVLTALMISMVFSGVFAEEHMRRTDQLVLCSRHGRGTLYLAKLLTALTLGAAGTVLVWGITLLSLGILYGYQTSWNAALQMYLPSSPFALTMGQAIVILAVLLLLSALLHSVLTLLLSGWTKNSVASMSLMVVYILGTMVLNVPERWRLLSQSLYLLPAKMVKASAFYDARLVGTAGRYLTNWQAGMILYPLLALLLALLGGLIYRRWQISGR